MKLPSFLTAAAALLVTTDVVLAQTPLRYMPFGDSITEIQCWRAKLWHMLQSTEFANTNFVGSGRVDNNCRDNQYDRDHEGHSGFLAVNIANQNQLVGWLQRNPADVITMHLGTNDIVQQGKSTQDILAAFTKLVTQMRNSNPRMKIIVAQIIPLGFGNYDGRVRALNAAIPSWAAGMNSTQSPIWVVDQYSGFNGRSDNRDGIHPNNSGDEKMSKNWYPALVRALQAAKADKSRQ